MPKRKQPQQRFYQDVEYEFDGAKYSAKFYVEDGWVHVINQYGSKSAALHASSPAGLARLLLLELLQTAKRDRSISKSAST